MTPPAGGSESRKTTMRTHGDYSPNFVGRDYTVIIQQMEEAKQRRWRRLETIPIPVFKTLEASLRNLLSGLAEGCERLPDPAYRDFSAIVGFVSEGQAGAYTLTSGHSDLFAWVKNRLLSDLAEVTRIRSQPESDAKYAEWRKEYLERTEHIKSWNLMLFPHAVGMQSKLVQIQCDVKAKTIVIRPKEPGGLDASKYPHHLKATSEFLEFVAALRGSTFAFMDNFELFQAHYPLEKFMAHFLDTHTIGLDRVRVATDDPEVWDYDNPEYDHEVMLAASSKPGTDAAAD